MQSFDFSYPTTVHFGEGALERSLPAELAKVGKTVMLAYGGGSIKRNGVYDAVMGLLARADKDVVEFVGIMPTPPTPRSRRVRSWRARRASTSSSPWAAAASSAA